LSSDVCYSDLNRMFFKKLTTEDEGYIIWTNNPHDANQKIYFISDVPHLIKTTRNCFENSHWNTKTRNMHFNGQDISWLHIKDVYEWDLGKNRLSPGLRKIHKVKDEHINLSPRGRMNVKAAAQVLSSSMANCLRSQGLHYTHSTISFVEMFDKVFDCMNVSRLVNKSSMTKPELNPYTSANDWRFKFLQYDFVDQYLIKWENQAYATPGLSREEQNKFLLSPQTRHGWKMSVKSFVELSKELLALPVPIPNLFLLSEKFSQDPLEEHFGRHRRSGGCNENPTLFKFGHQELRLNVMGSNLITEMRGNTRGRNVDRPTIDVNDMRQLPKRRKTK